MTWAAPESDLRSKLSDNATDKFAYRKTVFGDKNGVNTNFRTFEFRRITPFATSVFPLGVWLNGILQAPGYVTVDFQDSGDFSVGSAPANGALLEASYYYQWFTDTEIQEFLRLAQNFLALGDVYTNLDQGLRPASLHYAAGEAYEKLSLRWSQRLSEIYLTQDATEKDRYSLADTYKKWGDANKNMAIKLRNDFYSRSGENEIPYSSSAIGRVRDLTTSR